MNSIKKSIKATLSVILLTIITSSLVKAQQSKAGVIHHDIFLTLKNTDSESIEKQVELGKKYLSGHPGQIELTATVIAKGLTRHQQVAYLHNDEDFQVHFHFVFKDAKSHDVYQVSDRHKEFIKLSNPNWKKVRVFDTEVR